MKFINLIFLSLAALAANAAVPSGYYKGLEGKSGAELKAAAKSAVSKVNPPSYGNGTWKSFEKTDVVTVKNMKVWWDKYSPNLVEVSSGHTGLNIEHSVANSWWGGTKNDAYNDLNHLNPSDAEANSRKSNFPLGKVATVSYTNGVTIVGKPVYGSCGGATNVYEPCDEYKGDFARVFMYMFTMYDDISWKTSSGYGYMYDCSAYPTFKQWAADLLCEWARLDPVDSREIARNDAVYSEQGNRNPFIDNPELFEYLWGSKKGQAFSLSGSTVTPDPVDPAEDDVVALLNVSFLDGTAAGFTLGSASDPVNPWSLNSTYGLKASAYISNINNATDSWAISPVIDLDGFKAATLSFEWAGNYFTSQQVMKQDVRIAAREAGASDWTDLDVPTWPAGTNWTFVQSGDISLDAFAGKKIELGFRYSSTDSRAGTLEIKNLVLSAVKGGSTVNPDPVDPTPVDPDPVDPAVDPDGSAAAPYTVQNVLDGVTATDAWFSGYIVGWIDTNADNMKYSELSCTFSVPATLRTNLLMAMSPEVRDITQCIPVQLPSGDVRTALNLQDNPDNLGKKVRVFGNVEKYFGQAAALKNLTDYAWVADTTDPGNGDDPGIGDDPGHETPGGDDPNGGGDTPGGDDPNEGGDIPGTTGVSAVCSDFANAEVYDLNGRRLAEGRPAPGIYIVRTPSRTYKLIIK